LHRLVAIPCQSDGFQQLPRPFVRRAILQAGRRRFHPDPMVRETAMLMLSKTVRVRNRALIWKVRPIPRWTRLSSGSPSDFMAVEEDRAGARLNAAGDQVDEGRLAGAVGTDQGAALAARKREIEVR